MKAVEAARQRRLVRAEQMLARIQWFVQHASQQVVVSFHRRMRLAVEYLRSQVVRNISVPVRKEISRRTRRVRVTERSKPGEFPRADTTRLMKDIFVDVREIQPGVLEGIVGTTLDYGVILEVRKERPFLSRTLDEVRSDLAAILSGPIR